MIAADNSLQVGPTTIDYMLRLRPASYDWIRLDTNNVCNIKCVYCHNPRSKDLVDPDKLQSFLDKNVVSVSNFQIGCAMEPTVDRRLIRFMALVGGSKSRPSAEFQLQTNGILLHEHDYSAMSDAGLTKLSVSIDTINSETFKFLRGGADFERIVDNLNDFRKSLPEVKLQFLTTVTRANIDDIEDLVKYGLDLGVKSFVLREMYHIRSLNSVDHHKVRALSLGRGKFREMEKRIRNKYCGRAYFYFMGKSILLKNLIPKYWLRAYFFHSIQSKFILC